MPNFSYKAINPAGKPVTGELEASDRKRLIQMLSSKGMRPVSIEALGEKTTSDSDLESKDFFGSEKSVLNMLRISKSRSVLALEFLKRLLVLLQSGMSLGDAVSLLSRRLSDPSLQKVCSNVWKKLSEGHSLGSALREEKKMFTTSTLHLIEAGEASGNLIPILQRVVAYLEESREVRKNLIGSLMYPVFILTVAFAVVLIMLTFLLPQIRSMLDQLGGELPGITQLLLDASEASVIYGPFIAIGLLVAFIALFQWRKTEKGAMATDTWLLKTPIIGSIYLYSNVYTTTNLLSTLLGSGVNTTEALRLVERTIANRVLKIKFASARRQIQEGVSMAAAIQKVRYMPEMAMDILTVGENTGNIVGSLDDINAIYREELTKSLNIMTISTVAIALGGAITLVAVIAISVVLAILSVGESIQL